jgi:hypothetical protein
MRPRAVDTVTATHLASSVTSATLAERTFRASSTVKVRNVWAERDAGRKAKRVRARRVRLGRTMTRKLRTRLFLPGPLAGKRGKDQSDCMRGLQDRVDDERGKYGPAAFNKTGGRGVSKHRKTNFAGIPDRLPSEPDSGTSLFRR